MRIEIKFPTIMKMQICMPLEIENHTRLAEIKDIIFEKVWDHLCGKLLNVI